MRTVSLWLSVAVVSVAFCVAAGARNISAEVRSNWAVVVDASRYWFNYRHAANALGIYRELRDFGIPEDHIILMLADDVACSPRNGYPGQVFLSQKHERNVYGEAIQVDYRGPEVTVANLLRLLEGRYEPGTPANKRLDSDENANVLLYFTGHGGEEFFKFQDREELVAIDLAESVEVMAARGRFRELLVVFDTCQADSMLNRITTPGVFGITSALTGENAYSYSSDGAVGLSTVDRFTYHTIEFLEGLTRGSQNTEKNVHEGRMARTRMDGFLEYFSPSFTISHVTARAQLMNRTLHEILLPDFFANSHTRTHFVPQRLVTSEWFQE